STFGCFFIASVLQIFPQIPPLAKYASQNGINILDIFTKNSKNRIDTVFLISKIACINTQF
ncbi:hypothetical protein, partial [Actinobacillus pleuropneumoniae]|uniref:hypothetical protein n=1 Tax=Actinobacillus pleuropneumoniae TaxID=715 RepID=UPI003B01F35B